MGVINERLVAWVGQMRRLCKPDSVHWVDGSVEGYDRLCAQMVECGTFIRLNPEKRPVLVELCESKPEAGPRAIVSPVLPISQALLV